MSTILNHEINTLPVSMEFVATEDVELIVVPFAFTENIDDIHLEVNAVDSEGIYNYRLQANNELVVSPKIPKGSTVYIYRETDVDQSLYVLNDGAVFTASNIDKNFKQIRKSQQEIIGRFKTLKKRVDATLSEAGQVIKDAKEATEESKKATQNAKDIVLGKVNDSMVKAWTGNTQEYENQHYVSKVDTLSDLSDLKIITGRLVALNGFLYKATTTSLPTDGILVVGSNNPTMRWVMQSKGGTTQAEYLGLVGDNNTNNTNAVNQLESLFTGHTIDLGGKTYVVDTVPNGNLYINGYFNTKGVITPVKQLLDYLDYPQGRDGAGLGHLRIGTDALKNADPNYTSDTIAIGRDSIRNSAWSYMNIAMGSGTLQKNNVGSSNIAIGTWALTNARGLKFQIRNMEGSRNVAIGSLALHFLEEGFCNVAIGRDSMHSCVTGTNNVAIGYRAGMSAQAPVGLSGDIENQTVRNGGENIFLGTSTGQGVSGNFNTLAGTYAGYYAKALYGNTFIGSRAGYSLDQDLSFNNRILRTPKTTNVKYTIVGKDIIIDYPNHGISVGSYVYITFKTGGVTKITNELQWLQIVSTTKDTFTFASTAKEDMNTSGDAVLGQYETDLKRDPVTGNTLIGRLVCSDAVSLGKSNTIIGLSAGTKATSKVEFNVMVGAGAGSNLVDGYNNTFLGRNSGVLSDGTTALTSVNNTTCLGANSIATGSNQVQLGGAGTTVYAYGAVQDRSDKRDKINIKPVDNKAVNALLNLEVKQYNMDYRDLYVPIYIKQLEKEGFSGQELSDKISEYWDNPTYKDGSKASKEVHYGIIAQDAIKVFEKEGAVCDIVKHVTDGDLSTYTVGYQQLIPLLIQTVQDLNKRVTELEVQLIKE